MKPNLSRLLKPTSIALFGGGWAVNVIEQLQKSGFKGDIWPVHPRHKEILGIPCFRTIDDLPSPPDASFIGVNREATIDIVATLSNIGAGGATCFASGFLESEAEGSGGADLQARLTKAAGDMPILGPNCYGMLNYLDNVTIWPDQHGGQHLAAPYDRGIGIIAQSSNIAINMTMQKRGVPIAYVVTAGNQAQTGIAEIGDAMLMDDRVSAIGLYLEGFGDIRSLETFARKAHSAGKAIVALKIGRSEKAQVATLTHTASLAGNAATSSALLKRLGIIEVRSISVFLETLKLLDAVGPLKGDAICSISCSGGEASLIADLAPETIAFRDFSEQQKQALKEELGPIVSVANPLDYHTFIWGDVPKMTAVFTEVMADNFDLCVFILDVPRGDRCDPSSFNCAIQAILAAKAKTQANVAILVSLPENLSEPIIERFKAGGVVCLNGMEEGLNAIAGAIEYGSADCIPTSKVLIVEPSKGNGSDSNNSNSNSNSNSSSNSNSNSNSNAALLDEYESKKLLAAYGLNIPIAQHAQSVKKLIANSSTLSYPVVLKGLGIAHKTEAGAVVLNIENAEQLESAAREMKGVTGFLVEEMIEEQVAEMLVGVTRDVTGLLLLTIGAGGVLAELLEDTACVLLPTTELDIRYALKKLKLHKLLSGYRGKRAADINALVEQIAAIAAFAEARKDELIELDVNPLLACYNRAVAVDALVIIAPNWST